ncbi:MAG: hypothetical protein E5V58_30200, partial [Mesorhizobium sp.]
MNYEFETNLSDDQQPYEVTAFAKKHGLTVPAADAVLFAKGPSRAACDAGALAFPGEGSKKNPPALPAGRAGVARNIWR